MSKTPEELAQEYVIGEFPDTNSDMFLAAESVHKAFLAGYKAGHATGFDGAMKIQEAITEHLKKQIVEEMYNRIEPLLKEDK